MSGKQRVLAALRRGKVSPEDFLLPNVCDGGAPILRVGARILELRADGFDVATVQVKPTAVYELRSEPTQAAAPSTLTPVGEASHSPYDDDEGDDWADWNRRAA